VPPSFFGSKEAFRVEGLGLEGRLMVLLALWQVFGVKDMENLHNPWEEEIRFSS
jgi:hypothetical protein